MRRVYLGFLICLISFRLEALWGQPTGGLLLLFAFGALLVIYGLCLDWYKEHQDRKK